jgi:hypothetical protein
MMRVWGRWAVAVLAALALGVAGLELSARIAAERRAAAAAAKSASPVDAMAPEVPTSAEVGETEPSASPRLTY